MASEIVKYQADNGQEITVTEQDVRDLMAANGNAMENVTSQEVKMFLRLCQSQRLNPFTRDAYIVKYGNQPASVIAGKDAFVKRATRNKRYRGHEAGITFIGTDGGLHRREGSMLLTGEILTGGWAKAYLDGYECPIFEEVALSEYAAPDKFGKNGWSRMPATMIRKVALCHALREAFPEDLGGLYGAEEMDQARAPYEAPGGGQEPSTAPVEAEAVVEAVEPAPRPQADPEGALRKSLWREVAPLKERAVAAGVREEGITSWMAATFRQPDGSPKPMIEYTSFDIRALIAYLERIAQDAEDVLAGPQDAGGEPVLAADDIEF